MSTEAEPRLVEQWRAIQSAYLKTSNALDRELSARHGIGLNEFETLDLLAEHTSEKCRMKDLTADSPMTQSALSKIVDRLEKGGYVRRAACVDDRRSLFVELTDAGAKLHETAAVTHRELLAANLPG
ncbi:MarR family winged helix-turn-helix transcriptional regulator [Sinomonas sp.]|jgi:DNA-binding MarR family transcriptional regulator|uniref:MarR family winged helix-turn-helix transcriptional regulator n=1 Tax=Sinomonas sp. TaxID=1914986 RepID=UPI002C1B3462|nr:MarR family transcriptional regulator [Sinomonas sp.]